MAEIWDLYRKNAQGEFVRTGEIAQRGSKLPEGTFHMVVQIWIQNSAGDFLISQRSSEKSDPLTWEATGGSALSGETSLEAACREVMEELGFALDPQKGELVTRAERHYPDCDDFVDLWLFRQVDVPLERLSLQKEEVCNVMWASSDMIRAMVANGKWISMDQFNAVHAIMDAVL